jgi:glycosyltransferase involved in cell wall biosynthesis
MTAPLRVLVTADPELPVPPALYGGIERIIELLVNGLTQRGHRVTLLAHRDSSVTCEHVPYAVTRSGSAMDTARNSALVLRETLRRRPDVVQSFSRLAYLAPVLPLPVPKVMSYQRAVTRRSVAWGTKASHGTLHFTGCSRQLIRDVAAFGDWRVTYNAVPIDRYQFVECANADAPLVFLGRVEEIKGAHLAIEVARAAGRRLILAGNVPGAHRGYFESRIEPFIDGDQIKYVGPVNDAAKNEILGAAAALLMPILWDEPFGIVMAEALACGTPVVGLARGAVTEVVDDGETGYTCATTDEMTARIADLPRLDRRRCREAAERRFSHTALVDAYEALYRDVA